MKSRRVGLQQTHNLTSKSPDSNRQTENHLDQRKKRVRGKEMERARETERRRDRERERERA